MLDCCGKKVKGHIATTGSITAEDACNLMTAIVEYCFGPVKRLAEPIERLTDSSSPYVDGDKPA